MADPRTCWHNVIVKCIIAEQHFDVCLSCDTDLTGRLPAGKNYVYDADYDVWVHVPASRKKS